MNESMTDIIEKILLMQRDLDYVRYYIANVLALNIPDMVPAILVDDKCSRDLVAQLKTIYNKMRDLQRENKELKEKLNDAGLDSK